MFPVHTASWTVGQKRQSTMLPREPYDSDCQGPRRYVLLSQFRSQGLDSHKRRLCCHNGPPLRAVACFAFAKYSNQSAGQSSHLSDHRSWNSVCQEKVLEQHFVQTDL